MHVCGVMVMIIIILTFYVVLLSKTAILLRIEIAELILTLSNKDDSSLNTRVHINVNYIIAYPKNLY